MEFLLRFFLLFCCHPCFRAELDYLELCFRTDANQIVDMSDTERSYEQEALSREHNVQSPESVCLTLSEALGKDASTSRIGGYNHTNEWETHIYARIISI